ncbi:MAG: DJ-1/PfpI family protein [Oscillospiraceae bacterium]|nr:DJ-1/PfpI family protein [Oscillospiraceae bacterium]
MVYIVLGRGFEEMEAVVPCDLLRRAGVETRFVGIGGKLICGSRGICVQADCTEEEAQWDQAEMIVLPGGLGGVESIRNCPTVMDAVRRCYNRADYVAAICAAPTILAELGITEGRCACCYPGMEEEMGTACMKNEDCVVDGMVITGRAAGGAFEFGLTLVSALRGLTVAEKIAAEVVYS